MSTHIRSESLDGKRTRLAAWVAVAVFAACVAVSGMEGAT
jgi:hypothetical protein